MSAGIQVTVIDVAKMNRPEIVAENPIRNPLLLAIDYIVLAICCPLRRSSNISYIRSSSRLRNSKRDPLLAAQNLWHDLRFQLRRGVLSQRRSANSQAYEDRADGTTPVQFIPENEVVETVPVCWLDTANDWVISPFIGDFAACGDWHE